MAKRNLEICFSPDEQLWRAISSDMIFKNGKVRGNRLRLQISVARSSFANNSLDSAIRPEAPAKFNGIAEISAAKARAISTERIRVVCVDEPREGNEAHALIAFVSDARPREVTEVEISCARDLLADNMRIVRKPT